MRLLCTLCRLAQDPEVIEPDVLADDQRRYEATYDETLLAKARRGKLGRNGRKRIEIIPHFRRPHPALYHVGRGRCETKITFRVRTIVHWEAVERMPTGYEEVGGRLGPD